MKKMSKVTINKNKESAEIIIASNIVLCESAEAVAILEGIKETLVRSNFTPTKNFNYFMGVYNKILETKPTMIDDFGPRRNDIIITEIKDIFCTVTPSEKEKNEFLNWIKKVEEKIVYVNIDFMNEDGSMDVAEVTYYYYWNCFKDYVESLDSQSVSYYDKLKITPPSIVENSDDKDIITLGSVSETIDDTSKYTFGIASVDVYVKLQPTNLFYVGARPSVGKSMLVMNAALKNALNGIKSLYVSLEMTVQQTRTRVNSWIKGEERYRSVDIEKLNQNIFLLDAKEMNGDYIFSKVEKFAQKYPGCMIFLDYIGLIRYDGMDEWASLRQASRSSKNIALKTKCVFISCAMASRDSELSGFSMSSLFGSSTLEADADGIIGLEPIKGSGREVDKLDIKIAKNRNGVKDVDCWVDLDKSTMHFEDSN